jgi:hypothetical protein
LIVVMLPSRRAPLRPVYQPPLGLIERSECRAQKDSWRQRLQRRAAGRTISL